MAQKRVVVIGIDGGELSVIEHMTAKGLMPNLSALMKRGYTAKIDTYVKGSGQGWASFATGQSPEHHGVFYWNLYTRIVNSKTIGSDLLWDRLSRKGIRSCVINMSYTYPPRRLNGYMISGLGSGLNAADVRTITYPRNLIDEITREAGEYIVGCDYKDGDLETHTALLNRLTLMTKCRTAACAHIMKKYSPEFVVIVYRGADLIQHCYWNLIMSAKQISDANRPLQALIETYYKELDKAIGTITDCYNSSIKMVISDHGFGPVKAVVYLNNYFLKCGLLKKKRNLRAQASPNPADAQAGVLKNFYNERLKRYPMFRKLNLMRTKLKGLDHPIDMKETTAYSDTGLGVILNERSCQSPDVKHEVIRRLETLIDPETNERVVNKAFLKDQSYAKDMKNAPHILFDVNEQYVVTNKLTPDEATIFRYMNKEETAFFTGSHRRDGILIVDGAELEFLLHKKDIKITDVSAAILDLFEETRQAGTLKAHPS